MKVNGYEIKPRADLRGANLYGANLYVADLRGADLRGANLYGANLRGAAITGCKMSPFGLPEGKLIVWGKKSGTLVRLVIPKTAGRVMTPVGRKCRFSFAKVEKVFNAIGVVTVRNEYGETTYRNGGYVSPHEWCPDWRIECAPGIHAFLTKQEAVDW